MQDDPLIQEEEYEPAEVDPDEPDSWPAADGAEPTTEAELADWADQQRPVSEDEWEDDEER